MDQSFQLQMQQYAGQIPGRRTQTPDEGVGIHRIDIQGIDHPNMGFATIGGDKGQIIDEMAIFPRALSDEEIKALHELGKSGRSLASEEAIFHP